MSLQTASAWGFDGDIGGRDWVLQSVCRGYDPDMFSVAGHVLDPANEAALALCDTCPVRALCRDDYLGADRTPTGIIAGGWWWDCNGRAHPHPADRVQKTSAARVNGHVYAARKAITAARAIATEGITYERAVRQHKAANRSIEQAMYLLRHAPDLLNPVWEGVQGLYSAYAEAIDRRRSRQMEGAAL